MELGIVFPQTEIGNDPAAIRDFAQGAEALGFSHLMIYDHVLGADPDRPGGWQGPYDVSAAFHEPFVTFGYLAAFTTTLELVTGVLVLPQRQTALVAKQAAQVDLLSGQRLILGVGIGWNRVEYAALGASFEARGAREAEQIEVLRALWSRDVVDHAGRWHRIDRAGIRPRPQRPIPIWLGGSADALLRRTARLGDGWIPGVIPNRAGRAVADRLRAYLATEGRDSASFPIQGQAPVGDRNPETWRRVTAAWAKLGATRLAIVTMNAGLVGPNEHLRAAESFQEAVADL